jgi:hypothetical protein
MRDMRAPDATYLEPERWIWLHGRAPSYAPAPDHLALPSRARHRRQASQPRLASTRTQRDYLIIRKTHQDPDHEYHLQANQRGQRRIVERVRKEPIFDANVTEALAYGALRFSRGAT